MVEALGDRLHGVSELQQHVGVRVKQRVGAALRAVNATALAQSGGGCPTRLGRDVAALCDAREEGEYESIQSAQVVTKRFCDHASANGVEHTDGHVAAALK